MSKRRLWIGLLCVGLGVGALRLVARRVFAERTTEHGSQQPCGAMSWRTHSVLHQPPLGRPSWTEGTSQLVLSDTGVVLVDDVTQMLCSHVFEHATLTTVAAVVTRHDAEGDVRLYGGDGSPMASHHFGHTLESLKFAPGGVLLAAIGQKGGGLAVSVSGPSGVKVVSRKPVVSTTAYRWLRRSVSDGQAAKDADLCWIEMATTTAELVCWRAKSDETSVLAKGAWAADSDVTALWIGVRASEAFLCGDGLKSPALECRVISRDD